MKKFLVVLVLVLVLVTTCACTYVPSTRFMSRSQVNSLVKEYGTPQAELTLSYELKDNGTTKKFEIKLTYDLLLSQAPMSVIRFIQLAESGAYDNTVIDTYNTSSNCYYMIMGRYLYEESALEENAGKKNYYVNNALDTTFKGEFASNKYKEPSNGYAQFSLFSLAMYHDNYVSEDETNFDTANGTLILAMSTTQTLNSNNYAVFATPVHMVYKVNDTVLHNGKGMDSDARTNLAGFTTKSSSKTIYTDKSENDKLPSTTIVSQLVTLQVKILGDKDWSKLPKIGR